MNEDYFITSNIEFNVQLLMTFLNYVKAWRIFQILSAWAFGPEYITQCSIRPENKFTYKFNVITQQEGGSISISPKPYKENGLEEIFGVLLCA